MTTSAPPVFRVYTRTGRKAHLVPIARYDQDKQAPALCNYRLRPSDRWHGPRGGAAEVEKARALKLCSTCERVLSYWGARDGHGWR